METVLLIHYWMNQNCMKYFRDALFLAFYLLVIIFALIGISTTFRNSSPVEGIGIVDSLTRVNDSIKIKISKLDSIKDAKVIEVRSLDNDSSVKLFYELVSE